MKPHETPCLRLSIVLVCLAGGCLLAGCATLGDRPLHRSIRESSDSLFDEFNDFDHLELELHTVADPLSSYNRVVFGVNDVVYTWAWDPAARAYRFVTPQLVRVGIANAFENLATPVRCANGLLQLKFRRAGIELGRLVINSVVGVGGFFDPADSWFGIEAPPAEDFGQTLGFYGVGNEVPIVLPLLGQSSLRDALALVPDSFLNPAAYLLEPWPRVGVAAGDRLNYTSLHVGEYESLKADALDPYTLFRDAYRQHRQREVER